MTSLRLGALPTVLILLVGCLSLRSGDFPESGDWPPPSPRYRETIGLRAHLSGDPSRWGSGQYCTDADILGQALWIYRESDIFERVTTQSPDLWAEIHLTVEKHGSRAMCWISALTLGIIPCRVRSELTLTTVFRDHRGNDQGRVTRSATVTTWYHLLLIIKPPNMEEFPVVKRSVADLHRATILQARDLGIL